MNTTNDLKLVASKIMGWPEWVDEYKDPASLPAWWINDLGILIVERSDGSDLWNPIEYDADFAELLGRLLEVCRPLGLFLDRKDGHYLAHNPCHAATAPTLNAALFAFSVKLASELAKESK